MKNFNEKRHYEILTDMLNIYSPSKHEEKMAEYVIEFLERLGAEIHLDKSHKIYGGNSPTIVAKLKGNLPGDGISLSAHMDVIEPNQGVVLIREGNILKTDGTTTLGGDDKAGLAAILYAMEYLVENELDHVDIYTVITAAEEIGMLGAKNLNWEEVYKVMNPSKNILVLDSGGPPTGIAYQAPTAATWTINCQGKTAHAGIAPETGVNAIVALASVLTELPMARINSETTANVSQFSSDYPSNVVPDRALASGEMRAHSMEVLEELQKEYENICYEKASEYGAKIEIEFRNDYPLLKSKDDLAFAKDFAKVYDKFDLEPEFIIIGGGSDANFFAQEDFNSLIIGVGMTNAHTTQEYLKLDEMYMATKVIIEYLQKA